MCDKSRLILLGIEKDIELISIAPNDFGSVAKALDFVSLMKFIILLESLVLVSLLINL